MFLLECIITMINIFNSKQIPMLAICIPTVSCGGKNVMRREECYGGIENVKGCKGRKGKTDGLCER